MKTLWLYLSSSRMTVCVRVEEGRIVKAPPIVRKFDGQSYMNLVEWMQSQPGFHQEWVRD